MKGKFIHKTKCMLKKHSSTILTCVGAVGVVSTAVLAAKATPKAIKLLEEAEELKGSELTTTEKVQVAWKPYIPAGVTGVATIACIFGANVLSQKNQATLISAYALLDEKFKEYREAVDQVYGDNADTAVKKHIAESKYEPVNYIDDGEELYYDVYSERYFNANPEVIVNAEYELNKLFSVLGDVSLNDYYDLLGLPHVIGGDISGWSTSLADAWYGYRWIEFTKEKTVMEDGLEVTLIDMVHKPSVDYMCW